MSIASELAWMDDGLCAEPKYKDIDFFPDNGNRKAVKKAKSICKNCLVREECLEWAYTTKQPIGIFGGMTTDELNMAMPLRRSLQPVAVNLTPVSVATFKLDLTNPKPFVLHVP